VEVLLEPSRNTYPVPGFARGEAILNENLLAIDCDILIAAVLQFVITKENAPKVRARVIAEAANLPTTPEADEILSRRGVHILPDVLTNAGGVTVSYFEWAQNLQQVFWEEERVTTDMTKMLTRSYQQVAEMASLGQISLREAAYTIAVDRVARAERLRGT
jgi:glutamate dehydrogenase (NAD(P)+)